MAPNIITLTDPRSAAAEAYRALRTNLLFSALERALPTLLITTPSAATADAKSECAANLAVTWRSQTAACCWWIVTCASRASMRSGDWLLIAGFAARCATAARGLRAQ